MIKINLKNKKVLFSICCIIIALILVASGVLFILPSSRENKSKKKNAYEKAYNEYLNSDKTDEDKQKLKSSAIDYAEILANDKEYTKAIEVLSEVDEQERIEDFYYDSAKDCEKKGEYGAAVSWYEKITNKNVSDDLLSAKYSYVKQKANNNNKNFTTCRFLKELMAADYKDSAKLFQELYSWKAEIITNQDTDDKKTQLSEVEEESKICFHIKFYGGEPGETISASYEIADAKGTKLIGEWTDVACNGKECWKFVEYNTSDAKEQLSFRCYDMDRNLLCEQRIGIIEPK